ncbi:tRNA (adenine(37)-N6)-methyltransferase isoform X2 [Erinaceus europaeus]|nr:tRNA (adenine(37)-N6)-methyltransferase isoform X2 [Erinaceus europaeus]
MGLEQFSHIWVLFVFHKNGHLSCKAKVQPPRLNGAKVGVFATRSPHRPSAIGLTLAKLEKVEGGAVYLSGIDMIHGTPILDIKPYIADYDSPQNLTDPLGDFSSQNNERSPKADSQPDGKTESCDLPQLSRGNEPQPHANTEEKKLNCLEDRPSGENNKKHDNTAKVRRNSPKCREMAADLSSEPRNDQSSSAAEEKINPDHLGKGISEKGTARRLRSGKEANSPPENSVEMQLEGPHCLPSMADAAQCSVVPRWVTEAPVASLQVRFTPHAEMDLGQLSPQGKPDASQASFRYFQSAKEARRAIEAVLSADPRSVYRRKLCQDRLYYFSVDMAHVTCWFGDDFAEVLRIKPAPEPVQMTDPTESLVSLGS